MWETHLLSVEVGEEELLYQMIRDQRGEFVRLSKIELFSARNEVFVKHLNVPFLVFICYLLLPGQGKADLSTSISRAFCVVVFCGFSR